MCPVVVLSVLLLPLTVLLAPSVQQVVSSPVNDSQARLLPLNPGPVEDRTVMEERISKLMSLFNLQGSETTTAVLFGRHTRYLSRNRSFDLSYSFHILKTIIEHSNREN